MISDPQDVGALKEVYNQIKLLVDKADYTSKSYFGKDKSKQIAQLLDEPSKKLEQVPIDLISDKGLKACFIYLKGKATDLLSDNYSKAAEDLISKALKLNPGNDQAWVELGEIMWKKRDIQSARKCFESALQNNPKSKEALQNLAIVIKQTGEGKLEEKEENIKESIKLAHKAIELDLAESYSWYVLGNAHLTSFFSNFQNYEDLNNALKAYHQAETMQKFKSPDLYYSRGEVHTYLEKYKEAVADYMTAHQIDPTLNAKAMADNIKTFVIKTAGLINKKGGLKPKKVSEITKTIVPTFVPIKSEGTEPKAEKQMKTVGFEELKSGKNTEMVASCKILSYIDKAMSVPLSFLVMDSKGNCCCLSLYNTSKDVCDDIKPRSDCFIVEPFLSSHELMIEGKLLTYQCIKVTDLRNIYVNGKPLTNRFSKSEVVSKTMT